MKILPLIISVLVVLSSCAAKALPPAKPFEYRALWTHTNVSPSKVKLDSTHNVDNDWALWGHNLKRELNKGDYHLPLEAYALVDGKRDSSQLCFSSPELLKLTDAWVLDQWGTKGGRYAILPSDNKKVCQCELCVKVGNTTTSATPAAAAFVTKLAKKYPGHQFFMAAYHSTKEAPSYKLPKNVGVFLSTIDIPMRYIFDESAGYKRFDAMARQWRGKVGKVYVWEYMRNFDDYLTPYPCLSILQKRLQYYQTVGVTGVFINGSGYDYSTFDDLQSYVLAKLLLNCNADVDALISEFLAKYYPQSATILAPFYNGLEHFVRDRNRVIPYYGTMQETIEAYLDPREFVSFWVALDKQSKTVSGPERQRLNHMLTAMSFTRLLLKPSDDDRAELLLILKEHGQVPGLQNYKETGGSLDDFIKAKGKLQ